MVHSFLNQVAMSRLAIPPVAIRRLLSVKGGFLELSQKFYKETFLGMPLGDCFCNKNVVYSLLKTNLPGFSE